MADEEIVHRQDGARGRYSLETSGGEAELTYLMEEPRRMVINHTYVPPEARGKHVALSLVERAVADARAGGLKIVPVCSYVASVFKRRTDWAPLLA